jgi:hypothetical protein
LTFSEVKKLVPKGYIVLTTDMARTALKYKNDAISFKFQIVQKDSIIKVKDNIIIEKDSQLSNREKQVSIAKRKLFWNNLEKWSMRILVIYLGGKQAKAW